MKIIPRLSLAAIVLLWTLHSSFATDLKLQFDSKPVARHALLDITVIGVSTDYTDPLDEREIAVTAQVTMPDGRVVAVDGFCDVPMKRQIGAPNKSGKPTEKWVPDGDPRWKIRFAPWQVGAHQITVTAKDNRNTVFTSAVGRFECVTGASHGKLRLPAKDSPFLRFDDGLPWVLLGENMCWSRGDLGMTEFDEWVPALAQGGGNFIRVWMEGPGNFRVVAKGRKDGRWGWDFAGPARLDYLLQRCNELDIKTMLCLLTFGDFRLEFQWRQNPPWYPWKSSPYNVLCGGPCTLPADFWTHPEAQRRFKEYLRYWVARFGGYDSVGFWEFWNEVDIYCDSKVWKATEAACTTWHETMGAYVRSIDPYKHILTTSFAAFKKSAVWEQPHIELVQTHSYGRKDLASVVHNYSASQLGDYRKPHHFGEIGNDVYGDRDKEDVEGLGLHDSLWSGLLSGSIGGACVWWWDGHVHPHNLYPHFSAAAKFVKAVAGKDGRGWGSLRLPDTNQPPVRLTASGSRRYKCDLSLPSGEVSWQPGPANQTNDFVITRSGELLDARSGGNGSGRLTGLLHGLGGHKKLHNPTTFQVDLAEPGRFVVQVDGVSGYGGANLHIALDGDERLFKDFPLPTGWTNHATLVEFNGPYGIDLPRGRHRVTVENTGRDWVQVGFALPGYPLTGDKLLWATGLVGTGCAVAWVQNRQFTWATAQAATNAVTRAAVTWPPKPVPDVAMEVPGLQKGTYSVEFWDPSSGEKIATRKIQARNGVARVTLPPISRDLALWLYRRE